MARNTTPTAQMLQTSEHENFRLRPNVNGQISSPASAKRRWVHSTPRAKILRRAVNGFWGYGPPPRCFFKLKNNIRDWWVACQQKLAHGRVPTHGPRMGNPYLTCRIGDRPSFQIPKPGWRPGQRPGEFSPYPMLELPETKQRYHLRIIYFVSQLHSRNKQKAFPALFCGAEISDE